MLKPNSFRQHSQKFEWIPRLLFFSSRLAKFAERFCDPFRFVAPRKIRNCILWSSFFHRLLSQKIRNLILWESFFFSLRITKVTIGFFDPNFFRHIPQNSQMDSVYLIFFCHASQNSQLDSGTFISFADDIRNWIFDPYVFLSRFAKFPIGLCYPDCFALSLVKVANAFSPKISNWILLISFFDSQNSQLDAVIDIFLCHVSEN